MSTTTHSSLRSTVGRHYHRLTILRLARLLIRLWHLLNKVSHNQKTNSIVQQHVAELLHSPLFAFCRQLKAELGRPLSKDRETVDEMVRFLSRRENISLLPQAFLVTATEWAEHTQQLRALAKVSFYEEERGALHDGVVMLKANMWHLLSCGLLAELPASAASFTPNYEGLLKVAGVLQERYQVLSKAAVAAHFEDRIRLQLAEVRGLSLFKAVRAQSFGHAERGVEGLAQWLAEPQPLRRRALVSDLAGGLHELACAGIRLRRRMLAAPQNSDLQRVRLNALLVAEISYSDLLETRFFVESALTPAA